MTRFVALVSALAAMLVPTVALAHPHIWIQQLVRVVAKDGKYTHVEIEWRFDPFSSEIEIPLIDEDHDGKFSLKEVKVLAGEMLPELKTYGYMSWINTGAKDFRPSKPPEFTARIDDPASFMPADWDRSSGDSGMAMPPTRRGHATWSMSCVLRCPSPPSSSRSRPTIPTISSASRSTRRRCRRAAGWPSIRATRPSSSVAIPSLPIS